MQAPDINYRSIEWVNIKRTLAEELKHLDKQNRVPQLEAQTADIRTRLALIEEIMGWDRVPEAQQSPPAYAIPQG